MSSSNPKRSPKRSPRSSPKPKTPTLKNISNGLADSLIAAKEALPAGGIATLGLKNDDVKVLIDYPNILRGFLLIGVIATYVICLVMFLAGYKTSNDKQKAAFPDKMPYYVYSPWFAVIFLTASVAGIIYILLAVNTFSFVFTIAIIAYCFALVMAFVKFYYDVAINSSATQIYGFIIFVDLILLGMIVTQETNNFIFSLAALLPSLVLAGYLVYCGGILNGNVVIGA